LDIVTVVTAIGLDATTAHLPDIVADFIQEITVMRDDQGSAIPFLKVHLQPFYSFDVKVVGGLIKDEEGWGFEK
jgi:hypothetical protein